MTRISRRRGNLPGVNVVVETFREMADALLVATARGGNLIAAEPPFAFERPADGSFIVCLCDEDGAAHERPRQAPPGAAREAALVCGRSGTTRAGSIARGLEAAHVGVARERGATCSAVLVVVSGASVHVGWVGALEAVVLRDGEVVHRTTPHLFSLESANLVPGAGLADLSRAPRVNRALGMSSPGREPGVDLAGPWATEPGDLVVMCSAKVSGVLSEADLTALACRDDVAAIVRGLVTTASTRGDFVELSAIALRIKAPRRG